MYFRNFKFKFSPILLFILLILFSILMLSCDSPEIIGPMEANHAWLTLDPSEQTIITTSWDKQDSDIVYFVPVGVGKAVIKVNLKTKMIINEPNLGKFEKYTFGNASALHVFHSKGPLWIEFRGKIEKRTIFHLFGDPIPTKPGVRKATRRTGYYYIVDKRNGVSIELLRVKVINAEIDFGGLGSATISPNGKWISFELDNNTSRIWIFNREENASPTFMTDHESHVTEIW